METLKKVISIIDTISEWVGKIVGWLIIPLVLGTAYDVLMRYFFKAPTKWAYELTYMEYAAMFMLGGAYGLKYHVHVRVDIFFNRLSERKRAIYDALMYGFIFFPIYIILVIYSTKFAIYSWQINEHSITSYWQPPLYPIKTVMPVAFLLFLVEGFAEFIRYAVYAIKREPL